MYIHLPLFALFSVNFAHLHNIEIWHVHEAISSYFVVLAWSCLASMLDYIVMQMRKTNCEKGYCINIVRFCPVQGQILKLHLKMS